MAKHAEASSVGSDEGQTVVVGTTQLYENGRLRLIPMPTPDPRDPLNLPDWRKAAAVGVICFFCALALSAEIVMGGLIPIFILEYAGVDPRKIRDVDFTRRPPPGADEGGGFNPLALLPPGVQPPDLGRVSMLATIPLLANGIASYLLVPLSIAVGRRPVLLFSATCAWAGGFWAAVSSSLDSHLAARAVQGLGAGALEALIPLVVQDMFFIHQRNKWMSMVIASQGIVIIALGVATPYVAAHHSWRWIYWVTSGFGLLAWLLLVALLPETRWRRGPDELSGRRPVDAAWPPLAPDQDRPAVDGVRYAPRTWRSDLGVFNRGFHWRDAGLSMLNALRTTLYPAVVWAALANSVMIVAQQAAMQVQPFVLLSQGWQFQHVGLAVIPIFLASLAVYVVAGPLADRLSLLVTRRHGGGGRGRPDSSSSSSSSSSSPSDLSAAREPEHQLPNFVLPFACGVAGAFLFGAAAQQGLHWAVLLAGGLLIVFAFLTVMTLVNVYSVETYPMWAGPVLVNVSTMRIVVAFFLASEATTWVARMGPAATFAIYAEAMIVVSLGIPLLFFFGRTLRAWTAGRVRAVGDEEKSKLEDGSVL